MQAAQTYVSECDRVLRQRYDGARPHLRACSHHRIEICKDRVIEGNQIVRTGIRPSGEVGDGIFAEARQEDEGIVAPCPSEFVVAT